MAGTRLHLIVVAALVLDAGICPAHGAITLCNQEYVGTVTPIITCDYYNPFGAYTGSFTGFARKVETPNHVKIVLRGEFTGSGIVETWTAYTLGAWTGKGGIRAYAQGYFFGPSLNSTAEAVTDADSFDNNYADALVAQQYHNIQLDGSFYAEERRFGKFDGHGILTGLFGWDVGDGSLTLPHSGVFAAQAVPEPSSWVMFLMSFSAIGWLIRRRKRETPIAV